MASVPTILSSVQQHSLKMFSKILAVCATLAVAQAGNLAYAGQQIAYSSAPAVSSVYQSAPVKTLAYAPAIQYAAPALQTYAAPIAKVATYSSAPSVSQVYSSIAAPSHISYAPAQLQYSSPAIGSTHQSTVRSFDGTVSHQSKAIDTAFSSVRKSDTRISNNLYAPALATKTIAYAAPLATKTLAYSSPAVYSSAPAVYSSAPAVYSSGPAVYSSAPAVYAPKAISYSAAPIVSHVSFEGLGAQYAW